MTEFVVVTPTYNCADSINQTIKSVYSQSYNNWRMIIIDDMSSDNTARVCSEIAETLGVSDRIRVITRYEKYGETRNTIDVCENIDDNAVVVRLDGGDWLTDLDCFYFLDRIYSESVDPAVVWTGHRWSFTGTNISGPLDPTVSPYQQPWKSSHLKTFRKNAMNGINKKNYMDEDDKWIVIACDQAVFLPMLEKAWRDRRPNVYIDACMYHYSIDLHDPQLFTKPRSKRQKMSAEWIRHRGYIE